jgi:energy-coupling factor transporter transmembrane protein EcfT
VEDLIEDLAQGNVTEVKVVLATVVIALALYQVLLMAVGWGKVRVPWLSSKAASFTHRSVGDTIALVTMVVAFMCIGYFEIQDGIEHADEGEETRVLIHVIAAFALMAVFVLKIIVVRWWHRMGRFLPVIGVTLLILFFITWMTSAGDYLLGG